MIIKGKSKKDTEESIPTSEYDLKNASIDDLDVIFQSLRKTTRKDLPPQNKALQEIAQDFAIALLDDPYLTQAVEAARELKKSRLKGTKRSIEKRQKKAMQWKRLVDEIIVRYPAVNKSKLYEIFYEEAPTRLSKYPTSERPVMDYIRSKKK